MNDYTLFAGGIVKCFATEAEALAFAATLNVECFEIYDANETLVYQERPMCRYDLADGVVWA